MNTIAHFLINLFIIGTIYPIGLKEVIIVLVASTIIDIDHIFTYFSAKHPNKKMFHSAKIRTKFHELYGIIFFSIIAGLLVILGVSKMIVQLIFLSYLLHIFVDFLFVHSRPMYPFDKTEISFDLFKFKRRVWLEIAICIYLGGVLCLILLN
ncbi:metal-dependent hydrolase [Candidatus Woesearchaeota archaeon]|nr:metal-dependent hydrolase [Candidatus Woesearchaeota archaeon]